MEAASAPGVSPPSRARELTGVKAARIIEAMRVCVAARGFAGATFDQVAREAGVSRGLLHYYFATKERLLVEAVRRESDVRTDRLEAAMAEAKSPDEVLAALVQSFENFLGEGPAAPAMVYELMTLGQRNPEIAAELAELARRTREHTAELLQAKSEAGVIELRADADTVSTFLFALANGVVMRRVSEPDFDIGPVMDQAIAAARALLS